MEVELQAWPVVLLIIEDWRTRALIHAQLDGDGLEARTSVSWAQALTLLGRHFWPRLGAIIVDVGDRAADHALAGRLALLARHAPVVALTGSFGPRPEDLRRMGAKAVLRRPITVGEVSRALRTFLLAESAKA
jgi:CheY-like chemotaxis protein